MKKIIEVAAAVIVDESQRILVCERPAGKNSAGKWEVPGGKLEAGETPAAALQRELAEELAMQVRILSMMYQLQKVLPDGRLLRLYFLRRKNCRKVIRNPAKISVSAGRRPMSCSR